MTTLLLMLQVLIKLSWNGEARVGSELHTFYTCDLSKVGTAISQQHLRILGLTFWAINITATFITTSATITDFIEINYNSSKKIQLLKMFMRNILGPE